MNKIINFLSAFCFIAVIATSCEKEPILNVNQSSLSFTDQGGTQTISFSTNKDWTTSVSGGVGWCTVSPASGKSDISSITVTTVANDTYDDRSATITIKVGELSKTISITQKANQGIIISPSKYDLSNDASEIEVEIKANIEYDVIISGDWITRKETKGLVSNKIYFSIAKNTSYDNREGIITVKQKNGNIANTIQIFQSQTDAIIISKKKYELNNSNQSIEVALKTNVDFEVIIPQSGKDWITYSGTKALRDETLILGIKANTTYSSRTSEVYVKNKKTNLQDTISINQSQLDGLILTQKEYNISDKGENITISIQSNINYDVLMPTGINWISHINTKSLTTYNHIFSISANELYINRSAKVIFKHKESTLSDTLTINQKQKDAIIVQIKKISINKETQNIEAIVKSNIDYTQSIKDNWISIAGIEKGSTTSGLTQYKHKYSITANSGLDLRQSTILFKGKSTDVTDSLIISQYGTNTFWGNINISSKDDLIKFSNSGIANVFGDITINAIQGINSLQLLGTSLKNVSGELFIQGNYLTSLQGLESLESVKDLTIFQFQGESFNGLNNLKRIEGSLRLNEPFTKLKSFEGLENLAHIGKDFKIQANRNGFNSLISFKGLNKLENIVGDFILLGDFTSLYSFNGLSSLKEIGGKFQLEYGYQASYYSFDNLRNFEGLNSLTKIGGNFTFVGSFDNLRNFKGLEKLKYIGGVFGRNGGGHGGDGSCYNSLESFEGLGSLYHVGALEFYISIGNCFTKLTSLSNLVSLREIDGKVRFSAIPNLSNIDILRNIEGIKEISIYYCNVSSVKVFEKIESLDNLYLGSLKFLKNLEGLDNLQTVKILDISDCERLSDITGLSKLKTIDELNFQRLTSLSDLTPLSNVEKISSRVYFDGCTALTNFCPILNAIINISKYSFYFERNAYNPTYEEMMAGKCKQD